MADRPYVVALEEHFQDPELGALYGPLDANAAAHVRERLESFGGTRLTEMDAAGIDFQIISHSAPSVQKLDVESAVRMAPLVNDRLHAAIGAHPTRFGGFATIATPGSESRGGRVGTRGDEAGVQGRDDPRADQWPFP